MEVLFRTRKLEKRYQNHKEAESAYGQEVARKYILRVNTVKTARNLEELRSLPALRCHPLKGDRKGQWAINLTGFYRLIFTREDETLQIVRIEEVSKHYDG